MGIYKCMALQATKRVGACSEALKNILSTVILHLCWTQFVAQLLLSGHFLLPFKTESISGFLYNLIPLKKSDFLKC